MAANIVQTYRVQKIEVAPPAPAGGEDAPARVRVSFVDPSASLPAPDVFSVIFDSDPAATFFVVNEETELTFAKPAS